MNYRKFIRMTKDYLDRRLVVYPMEDLHAMPTVDKEDLLDYVRASNKHFRRPKFSRFLRRLDNSGFLVETTDKSIVFAPIFPN